MRIYLAGPIQGRSDSECMEWRDEMSSLLTGHECVNPMRRDYRGRELSNVQEIISQDLSDIDSCETVLAYCPFPSYGTAMEVFYAYSAGKRVIVVCPNDSPSPWLAGNSSELFKSLGEAVAFLTGSNGGVIQGVSGE